MSLKITILDDTLQSQIEAFSNLADYSVRHKLLAQVIRAELLNLRKGNAHTKTRGEVRGGGKKPWKQKGTGRARHGSTRSPIWVGGGITFGPRSDRNWHCKINKTSRIAALKSVLKDRLDGQAVYQFADSFDFPQTKQAVTVLSRLSDKTGTTTKQTILLYTLEDKSKLNGFANTGIHFLNAGNLKIHKLAGASTLVVTPKAREVLEERIA